MKTVLHLALLICLLTVQYISGQNMDLPLMTISEKYTPYIDNKQVEVTLLLKKQGTTQLAQIGGNTNNENTVFCIGSATKKMTAILLLQEQEKGHLKLSDSIGTYLSPINNVDGSLTIETLLRHRSGLGEIIGRNIMDAFFTEHDSVYYQNILKNVPVANPETIGEFEYTNTNYILLGRILEKVTDKSYFDLVTERILKPCGMKNSYPYVSKGLKNLARPIHDGKDVYEHLDARFFKTYANAAGSVASTLSDMALFYEHLMQNNSLLNPSSLKQLLAFDDADYGLGMFKQTDYTGNYIGHGGNIIGYAYRELYDQSNGDFILYFTNTMYIPFKEKITLDCIKYLNNEEIAPFNLNMAADYAFSKGNYFLEPINDNLEIIEKDTGLVLKVQGREIPLLTTDKNILFTKSFGIEIEVNPENNDEIIYRQSGHEIILKRSPNETSN